jgi:uncharacterized protein (DUF983 family)
MKPNLLYSILTEKCPKCLRGHVYKKKTDFVQLPVMNTECEKCGYHFDREPGYFIGDMYVSYGLAVLEALISFLICYYFFPSLSAFALALTLVAVIALFSMKNYKLSRVIYMHIFPW